MSPTILRPGVDYDPDEQSLQTAAGRLGKSARWLQSQLAEDRRRPAGQRLQFHHFMGRSPRWSEAEFQKLRAALHDVGREKNDLAFRADRVSRPVSSLLGNRAEEADQALAHVMNFLRPPRSRR